MKIPIKFKINTDDFKVFFDNNKKTHVCENVETGEQTNIGVLGILMQMGILKPIEENRGMEERIKFLSEKIDSLENKIDEIMRKTDNIPIIDRKREVKEEFEEPVEEEEPKSDINKRIMRKVLEQTEKKEEPIKEEEEEVDEEEEDSDAAVESDEEIDNWMKI
jgi:hypothetical protein